MDTPQSRSMAAMHEPTYAVATVAYNRAGIWRRMVESFREAIVKNGYPFQTRPGLFETAQSVYARPRQVVNIVESTLYDEGTVNLLPGGRRA